MTARKISHAERQAERGLPTATGLIGTFHPDGWPEGGPARSPSGVIHWIAAGADKPLCGRGSTFDRDLDPELTVTCKDCARMLAADGD